MASRCARPSASSTIVITRVWPTGSPRSRSSSASTSASWRTKEASGTFGMAIALTEARTVASRSRTSMRHGRFTRTVTSRPAAANRSAIAATRARASSFWAGPTLSSRSICSASASPLSALSTNRSLTAGTKRIERQTGSSRASVLTCTVGSFEGQGRRASSARISSVCSPSAGAGRRKPPGVTPRRGTTLCIGIEPSSASSTSTIASRPRV